MKKRVVFILLVLSLSLSAQTTQDSMAVIRATATEGYVGAYFNRDVEGLAASLHPQLVKQRVKSVDDIHCISVEDLREVTSKKKKKESFKEVKLEYQILDMTEKMAAVRVTNIRFWDFIFLAKFDTTWLITNVIWDRSDSNNPEGKGDVEEVAVDFVKSFHIGNVEFIEKYVHPEVDIRSPISRDKVDSFSKSMLIELAKSGGGDACECSPPFTVEAEILDELDGYASMKVVSKRGTEYLHLRYIDDQWFVMNGLWNRCSSKICKEQHCKSNECCKEK